MSVRAWRIGEPDLLGYDLEQDRRWDEVAGSDFEPADPSPHGGFNARPTRGARRVTTPMNAVTGHGAGLDGRPVTATSSKSVAALQRRGEPGTTGPVPGSRSRAGARPTSSRAGAGTEQVLNEQTRPGGHPSGS